MRRKGDGSGCCCGDWGFGSGVEISDIMDGFERERVN